MTFDKSAESNDWRCPALLLQHSLERQAGEGMDVADFSYQLTLGSKFTPVTQK